MKVRSWANWTNWAKVVGILGTASFGIAAVGCASLPARAEIPTGAVCRVDKEFGVRCRDWAPETPESGTNERAMASSSSSYDRLVDIGRDRYNGGDFQGAIAYYTQAISLNSNTPQAFSLRGTAHLSSQQPQAAITDYTRALELSTTASVADAANYVGRGMGHAQMGQLNEAVIDATQAISIHPSFAAAYFLRGNARHQLQDTRGACTDWQQAANLYWEVQQFQRYTKVVESVRAARC